MKDRSKAFWRRLFRIGVAGFVSAIASYLLAIQGVIPPDALPLAQTVVTASVAATWKWAGWKPDERVKIGGGR